MKDLSILITGGTGSFGREFVKTILGKYPDIKRLVVFSRDELKQHEMRQQFSDVDYPGLRYFLGDIRDESRLRRAFRDIDIVVHAAALKQVPAAEYNPMEFIKTNVIGAENVINAALDSAVQKVIALSTDKAAAPINLYGATKLCSDKLFIAANNIVGKNEEKSFSIVRYGNVLGSRGSILPLFKEKRKDGVIPITHPDMTRFNISLREGIDMVIYAIQNSKGGELFVPKIPSFKVVDIAEAIAPDSKIEYIGIRPGEKLHEEMITKSDSFSTVDIGDYFIILPNAQHELMDYYLKNGGKAVPEGFSYNSKDNDQWLSVDNLRELINKA